MGGGGGGPAWGHRVDESPLAAPHTAVPFVPRGISPDLQRSMMNAKSLPSQDKQTKMASENQLGDGVSNNINGFHNGYGLKILIVGAGIGGLTAAIALRKQGHEVLVIQIPRLSLHNYSDVIQLFEQSQFSSELGAAIHLAPNSNGILRRLGIFAEDTGANPMRWVVL